jgi:ABC-type bacteriocin/lantibiotic exporter with double-glycine peptidase domain
MKSSSLFNIITQLWEHISKERKRHFVIPLILTVIASISEIVSLGAVLPFIGILTQPENVFNSPWMQGAIHLLDIQSKEELLSPLVIGFGLFALFAGALRLLLVWYSFRLSNATGSALSVEVYRRTLYQPYRTHIDRSSSKIISGITQKVALATNNLVSTVTVITSSFLFFSIIATLIMLDPVTAFVGGISFGLAYMLVAVVTKSFLVKNSISIAK